MDWTHIVIAILGGGFAGFINTFAGNGSAITLTILTEIFGLPGNIANGTNRIGIASQGIMGTFSFYRNGKLNLDKGKPIIFSTIVGAIAGVLTSIYVSSEQFMMVFRILMVVMLFILLIKPGRWLKDGNDNLYENPAVIIPLFLGLGFYGGFIQMGMGIFFLMSMVLVVKYNIILANAIKTFVVLIYTIMAIALFQWKGLIDWPVGLTLAIGQAIGGYSAAEVASRHPNAKNWAYRILLLAMGIAVLKLFDVF
ncbi:MAG: sulfite exporter TauE/SafE family protein [Bacteroidia bacterium]|nr:sulfite exporter TauE/SafE family protein [Bacteroidia bacterium]